MSGLGDLDDDLDQLDKDLEQLRGGRDQEDGDDGKNKETSLTPSKEPVQRAKGGLLSGLDHFNKDHESDGEDGPWLANFKRVIYLVIALVMLEYVLGPITLPNGTVLLVAGFGMLALGVWAGVKKGPEIRDLYHRVRGNGPETDGGMTVYQDFADLRHGRIRVVPDGEPIAYGSREFQASVVFIVGILLLALTQDYVTVILGMMAAGVFVRLLFGKAK